MKYRIDNTCDGFYELLGKIFGSRKVERVTNDRFYDDDNKEWIVHTDSAGKVVSTVSVLDHRIKNIFSEVSEETVKDLKNIYGEISQSIVPAVYKDLYIDAGYYVADHSTNFVRIIGGYHEKQDTGID